VCVLETHTDIEKYCTKKFIASELRDRIKGGTQQEREKGVLGRGGAINEITCLFHNVLLLKG